MIVGVTGTTGYLGRFITHALTTAGHRVRGWRRPESDVRGFDRDPEWHAGSLTDESTWDPFLQGVDALVHAAFDHIPGHYRGGEGDDPQGFLQANLRGSINLAERARALGVKRFIFISSRAVYGERVTHIDLDENHPCRPDTLYGAIKAATDAYVSARGRGNGWLAASLRVTGVFGLRHPLQRSKWFDLVRAVLAGQDIEPRGGTEVFGGDLGRAVVYLLERDDIAGEIFNVGDRYLTTRDLVREIRKLTGIPGALPEAPADDGQSGIMDCSKIRSLGFEFSGDEKVTETLAALIEAVRAEEETAEPPRRGDA